jgi:hypothetical protein
VLIDAGQLLVDPGEEAMPDLGESLTWASQIGPARRHAVVRRAGLTSGTTSSHLLSFAEYLLMHVLAWSDVLWPTALPTFADIYPREAELAATKGVPSGGVYRLTEARRLRRVFGNRGPALERFRVALWKVRRVLANVPTYMIFDDHEITDDWYMTREFCRRALGGPLGRRVIENGLAAFTLCQGWGNTPEPFEDRSPAPPGLRFLRAIVARHTDAGRSVLAETLSVSSHDELMQTPPYAVTHRPGSIAFHYTVEGPHHQVIVTDTRTWRSFPPQGDAPAKDDPPELISPAGFAAQFDGIKALDGRALGVVVTTNAPPTPNIRAVEPVSFSEGDILERDVFDSWNVGSRGLERLYARIARHTTEGDPSTPSAAGRSAVLMSGDVHHSFVSRIELEANRLIDDGEERGQWVFAQLVASGFKNQDDKTAGLHRFGYHYSPELLKVVPPNSVEFPQTEVALGWRVDRGRRRVGYLPSRGVELDVPVFATALRPLRSWNPLGDAAFVKALMEGGPFAVDVPPDWWYRIDYVRADGDGGPVPPVPNMSEGLQLECALVSGLCTFRRAMDGAQVVGFNNLGEIRWPEPRWVHQIIRWRHEGAVRQVRFRADLTPRGVPKPWTEPS